MRRPRPIKKSTSKRSFRKFAKKTNPKNRTARVMRGGIRL